MQVLGMYPCQVLYSRVFSSSAVGGSWPPCPPTWKLLLLLVAQWLTCQWSTLTRTGGVRCIESEQELKEHHQVTAAHGSQTHGMRYRPQQCHLAQFHQASTDLQQAASLTSQTGIAYPCPRNPLPRCQQHSQKILENKPCCSQEPESQHKLCTQSVTARSLLLPS